MAHRGNYFVNISLYLSSTYLNAALTTCFTLCSAAGGLNATRYEKYAKGKLQHFVEIHFVCFPASS